jgi:CRP-like cAMP-binding protein
MLLPDTGFLSDASQELRDMLDCVAVEVRLKDDDTLFEEGDEGDALYAVVSGAIELSVLSHDGRKLGLDVLRPGAVFGEIALFDPGTPRTATATAAGDTRLLRVRNSDLMQALRREPDLALDLVKLAGQRMRWMSQQLSEQVFYSMPCRLARKILHLTAHASDETQTLEMSQSELAEFVGATREAVSKTLSGWQKKGLIEKSRKGLSVKDKLGLQAVAEAEEF